MPAVRQLYTVQTPPYGTLRAASSTGCFTGASLGFTGLHRLLRASQEALLGASLDDLGTYVLGQLNSAHRLLHNPSRRLVSPLKHGPRGHRPTGKRQTAWRGKLSAEAGAVAYKRPGLVRETLQSRFGQEKPGTSFATNL
ncbi:hypothetical protein E4U50_000268 [Claviceps purpurea]|nr:hypothetical protein E4U50_000268 [Claviceps purpurea]